jgi:hypothetical protein
MQWNITHTKNSTCEGKAAPAHSDKKTFSCSPRKPPPHPYTAKFVAYVRTIGQALDLSFGVKWMGGFF